MEADGINLGTVESELCLFSSTQDLSLLPFYSRKLGTLPVCVPGHRTLSMQLDMSEDALILQRITLLYFLPPYSG